MEWEFAILDMLQNIQTVCHIHTGMKLAAQIHLNTVFSNLSGSLPHTKELLLNLFQRRLKHIISKMRSGGSFRIDFRPYIGEYNFETFGSQTEAMLDTGRY